MQENSYDILNDVELVDKTINTDKNYFEGLVLRYQNRLYSYLFRILNFNSFEAQECLSQTFIQAYTKLTSYQSQRSFSSWIYKIAHNVAIDYIRKNSGKHLTFDPEYHTNIPAIAKNEFKEMLDFVLNKLNLEDKNILILFYIEGLSLQELSDIYNLLPNTIAARIKRAKEKAKKLISKYYV